MDMTEVRGEGRQVPFGIFPCSIKTKQRQRGKSVAQMPNSAFSPECRVPENAERCGLGLDLASLADRALGIISGVLQGV